MAGSRPGSHVRSVFDSGGVLCCGAANHRGRAKVSSLLGKTFGFVDTNP